MAQSRLFKIVYLLLERRKMTAKELSERLEVSQRTIYRDIDALSAAGVPIYATQGKGGGVALMDGFVLDRAALTEDEQSRLLAALRAMPTSDLLETDEILTKLSGLFQRPQEDWLRVELSPWQSKERGADFEFYKNVILSHHIVTFTYISSYGTTTRRRVLPARLVFKGHTWYLQAWCLDRAAYRTFRLSRILELSDAGETMALPQAPPDIDETFPQIDTEPISLRFSPALAYRVYDEFDPQDIRREPDGALRVDAPFPVDGWLLGYLLSFGVGVEVLAPNYLKKRLALLGREIYRAHGELDTPCHVLSDILDPSSAKEECSMDHQHTQFCQSCGMPLTSPEDHGSEADGSVSPDYCKYCYDKGGFTSSMTMEEMIDFCAGPMAQANPGMTQEQAKAQMRQFFPLLLRWKKG